MCGTHQSLSYDHLVLLRAVGHVRRQGRAIKADARDAEWESIAAIRGVLEQQFAEKLSEGFRAQGQEIERNLYDVLSLAGYTKSSKEEIEALLRDGALAYQLMSVYWEEWAEDQFIDLIWQSIETGFSTGVVRMEVEEMAYQITPGQEDVAREISSKIKGSVQTTRDEVARIVGRAVGEGKTRQQIADELVGVFSDWESWRAQSIATTTATGTFEAGQVESYFLAGIAEMEWLSLRDGRVRDSHQQMDSQRIPVGGVFPNGLRYPGDPQGEAEEVIGCRCSTVPVIESAKSVDPLEAFNARERGRIDLAVRDLAIRTAYPALRKACGQTEAIAQLASDLATSESTVKRALWP